MKKSYLIICVICLTLIMSDIAKATIPVVWQADPDGSGVVTENNVISRVKLTPDNKYVMVFHFNSGGPTRVDKLDASTGNFVWPLPGYKTVTKPGQGISLNAWVDGSGNLFIMSSWGGYTIWKYDSELDTELCSYPGGRGFEYVKDAINDELGNLYVAGMTGSGSNEGSRLVKLDSSCNEIWTCLSQNTTQKDDYGLGIALDSSKNVFRVGMDSSPGQGASYRGRLIGHSASNGAEFLNYTVNETNSSISGITIDSDDYMYIAYCYGYSDDGSPSGQVRTVVQKLERVGSTANVVWEYRFDDIGMYLGWDSIVKHTENSFYVAFNFRQDDTTVPGIAEFDLNGNLLWKHTIDRPGWNLTSGIDVKGDYIYVGLTNRADSLQTQVLCLQPLILLSPNGGESFISGTTQRIEWSTPAPAEANVTLEYSVNNAFSWITIDANTENDGQYDWLVPEATSNQCLVRISDAADANIFDTSDKVFTIFVCQLSSLGNLNKDCKVDFVDFAILAQDWLRNGNPFDENCTECPAGMVWVDINDPGVSGHEGFSGQMSKYETTNAQYCEFLNAALASADITVSGSTVYGATGSNSGADYVGEVYYDLAGAGYTGYGITNGGAARINYSGSSFTVDGGFENHPVTYVSWYGATAFCNYYGYRLPTEWEWQAVADYDGSYTYGCGTTINNSMANYYGSSHPYGTTIVGAFGTYGYGMCDMAGNAYELTSSVFDPQINDFRVPRGGSWYNEVSHCTVSFRHGFSLGLPYLAIGFRVCR